MYKSLKMSVLGGCVICAAMLVPGAGVADDAQSAEAPQHGIWQKHVYSFAYMGFTSTYSCDGLADKLRVLLIAAGARRDAKSQPGACAASIGRPDKFARADLTFYTLAPDAGDAAGAKPVDAVWRPVSFADHSPRELATGDCELIEQFRTNVLPMFTTRSLDNRTSCIPHQLSGSNISLRFDSLSMTPGTPPAKPGGA